MSAFLGFIHHLMWEKINFTESLSEEVVKDLNNIDEVEAELNKIGTLEKGELSELIDNSNIHGWLLERVNLVEKRFAKAVEIYLQTNSIDDLKIKFFEKGKAENFTGSKIDAYKLITSKFLDGMPCDGSIRVLSDSDDIEFMIANDVHKSVWNDYAGVDVYWLLRDEFVRGLLDNKYSYEKEENIYFIRG
ncbi:hypothetical protein [Peptoniphilus indolicus]|uniref:Uncharacterized protein n=2 Tax=Peptoniphilus indolicus TaxID=33030 RepID=G4D428_9FIRM|nr:hypothetical protein [Peptoniphilus indolicus]EGY79722.1 hypothetical protein HMPREF9129_1158 [Peptoniphilus indolicus ATCC 29427]SUB75851.1 Uncharacterised protein [Peptoniphilus indolicus]